MFGVALIVFEAAAKATCAEEHLARGSVVAVRFFSRKGLASNLLQKAFANTDSGNGERTNIEIAAERGKDDGGDAHNVGAVAPHAVGFHTLADVATENVGKALAKERQLQSRQPVTPRTWCNVCEGFGVSAQRDRDLIGKVGAIGKPGFEQGANVATNLLRFRRPNHAGNAESGHQADGADGKLRALQNGVVSQDAELQAAATQVDDAARRRFRTERGNDSFAAQTRFFLGADYFQTNAGGLLDAANQTVTIRALRARHW